MRAPLRMTAGGLSVIFAVVLAGCSSAAETPAHSNTAPPGAYSIRQADADLKLRPSHVEPKTIACRDIVGASADVALDFGVPAGEEAALRCYTGKNPQDDSTVFTWLRCLRANPVAPIYVWHGRRGQSDTSAYVAMRGGVVRAVAAWPSLSPDNLLNREIAASDCD